MPGPGQASVAVVLISKGRPEVLDDTIDSVVEQTLRPAQILVVVPGEKDLPHKDRGAAVQKIVGPLGICVQRNAAIDAIPADTDVVAFFDDDFELRPDYLDIAVRYLAAHPEIVAFSGQLLANGEVSRERAKELVRQSKPQPESEYTFQPKGRDYILHGCNMIIRRSALSLERFDENLPLYAYGEDYEMSMRLERHGQIGKFSGCLGVHLETAGGRVREVQRGYSFIANNWYFVQRGSVHLSPFMARVRFWVICVAKPIVTGLLNQVRGDKSKDWPERVRGYFIALGDLPRGRCHPKRILEL